MENNFILKPRYVAVASFILMAALMRILPHPWNLSPVDAIALFGGAQFRNKYAAFLFPLGVLLLSDCVLGFDASLFFVYPAYALIVCLGLLVGKNKSIGTIAAGTVSASLSFFLMTNFGVWAQQSMYPKTWAGLNACYVAAIPFFKGTLVGDALFVAALFGAFALVEKGFPQLRESSPATA